MKMKKGVIGVAAALAAILMVASGCSSSGGSTESGTDTTSTAVSATNQQSEGFEIKYPESLQEQFGESLKMEKTPERIIVMTAGPVMTLYEMGVDMVAIPNSSITEWPDDLKAERLPFGMNEIDMESIIALKPDLVILSSTNKEKYGNTLESQGIACYYVNAGPTVQYDEIKTEVQILGEAFNKKEETDAIMKKFTDLETDMAAFKEKSGGKSVGILFSYPPSYMQGSGGYLGDMLEKLGYVNISDKDGQATSNAQLSMEDLIVANPDLLFAVSPTTKTGDDLKTSYEQEFANNPQTWNQLSAVQNDKVVYLGSIYAKSSGINIIDDIRSLMNQLEQYN